MARGYRGRSGLSAQRGRVGRGRLGSLLAVDEEEVLLVPRRMERTLCSLLGGLGVNATGDGLDASVLLPRLSTCCCFTSNSDCSAETNKKKPGQHKITVKKKRNRGFQRCHMVCKEVHFLLLT